MTQTANKMWGGRFDAKPSDIMEQINASIDIDKRLYKQDIMGSRAHAKMLAQQNILPKEDVEKILLGLDQVQQEIETGKFNFRADLEDIHMNIESRLRELVGDSAGRLHTARSRNDQVATDFKFWTREACDQIIGRVESLQDVIARRSEELSTTIMPGFTHLQVAQPVTMGYHLNAYWHMLERDKTRFQDGRKRLNQCPLGAAALAGTSFPINRDMTAKELGFDAPMANTMDAVASRDFATEFLFNAAQCALNLSRLAEEMIIWSTPQFGFVTMNDAWSTGSSIMPQKKNPDAAELVRGKTGRMMGNLNTLMIVLKGLPLTYNKDLQEDKEPVFDSFDNIILCIDAMNGMIDTMKTHEEPMLKAAESGFSTATDLADWLVRVLHVPFRDAHHITGRIVKMAEEAGCELDKLPLDKMQEVEPQITDDIYKVLNVESVVKSRGLLD